jgi:hypothetical protein
MGAAREKVVKLDISVHVPFGSMEHVSHSV